jgi:hypothetical protein
MADHFDSGWDAGYGALLGIALRQSIAGRRLQYMDDGGANAAGSRIVYTHERRMV